MDAVLLARLQFAMTVMFHFIFPAATIGLGLLIGIVETLRWRTGNELFDRMATFWTRLFALTFVIGVATGVVMEFEFGTNWSRYATFVGDIFGSPLAAEGIFAFFLESAFLGLLLFGRARISSFVRWLAAILVMLGSTLSAFWIIVADSWMQTPAGYVISGDRARLTDFWAAVFNPSTLPRFIHTVTSAWVCGAFLMLGISAYYLVRRRHVDVARASLSIALVVAFIASALMFVTGDTSSRQVANTQVAKFAAMQGLYQTTSGAPLVIWSLPPTQNPADALQGPEIVVTRLLSFLSFGSFQAPVTGLQAFPPADWPPVTMTFLAYHNMVLLGTFMLLEMLAAVYLLWRGAIERHPTFLRLLSWSIPLPFIAVQLGWMTAEIGRQPWIVYDVMRTTQGVSTAVPAGEVLLSLALLAVTYAVLASLWLYALRREILHGPAPAPAGARVPDLVIEEPATRGVLPQPPRPGMPSPEA